MSLYATRQRRNSMATGLAWGAAIFGLAWLFLILGSLLFQGLRGLSPAVFTEMTPPPGSKGGLLNAIAGSLVMTAIGVAIGAPLGLLAGTYLAEYGRGTKLATVVRFVNDILLSAPSIVIGLFVYTIVVAPMGHFSGISGAAALSLLVIPVVLRTTEDMLLLVPGSMREAAAALGAPRAAVISRVAYRAAKAGIVSPVKRRRCFLPRSTTSSGAPTSMRRWRACRSSSSSSRFRLTRTGSSSPGRERCSSPSPCSLSRLSPARSALAAGSKR
jgi:phosphate transport system permease protein